MSYEGYEQVLCENGHYNEIDSRVQDPEEYSCPFCGAGIAWFNCVDQTNSDGSEYHIELDIKVESVYETCDKCGSTKLIKPAVFIIPIKE